MIESRPVSAAGGEAGPPRLLETTLAALACGLLALGFWRFLLDSPDALRSVGRDYLGNLWNLWRERRWLLGEEPELLRTGLLFHPNGSSLAAHTTAVSGGLLAAPLAPSLGLAGSYHLLWIVSGAASAWCAWLLARIVTGSCAGAAACGLLYGLGPFHTFHFTQVNHMFAGWLPLALLGGLALARRPGPLPALFLAAVLAGAGWTDWYELILALIALALTWPFFVAGAPARAWLRSAAWSVAAGAGALLLLLPIAVPTAGLLLAPGAERLCVAARYPEESDLLWMRPPGSGYLFTWPVCFGYLGCAALLLAVPAFRRRASWPWWTLLVISFILLQGTTLNVAGRPLPGVPMPMRFFEHLPVLRNVRVPHRFLGPVVLAVGMLGALGVARWRDRGGWRARFALALPLLLALELQPRPIPALALGESALPPELESGPGRGAVLELPLHFYSGFPMYLQTRHRRPLVGGYLSYVPPAALEHLSTPLMRALQPAGVAYDSANYPPPLALDPATVTDEQAEAWRRELRVALGVTTIVFRHRAAWAVPAAPPVSRRAAALLPFRFNPPAAASELYRAGTAASWFRQQAEDSTQARALLERLFGAPDRTVAGQVEIWQLAP